jgi:hypothetical protein
LVSDYICPGAHSTVLKANSAQLILQRAMASQKDAHICIFGPLHCDISPKDGRLCTRLETPALALSVNNEAPFSSLTLAAWALLLKTYLATDLISFSSSGVGYAAGSADGDAQDSHTTAHKADMSTDMVYSLEIADHDKIWDIVRRVQEPSTQRCLDPALWHCVNTILVQADATTTPCIAPRLAHQVCRK